MLTDTGADDRFAAGVAIDFLDNQVRLDQVAVAVVIQSVPFFQLLHVLVPGAQVAVESGPLAIGIQEVQRLRQQADVMPIDVLDLVDLGYIDIEMGDVARAAGEIFRVAGDPVVESRPDRYQEVAVVNGVVGERRAVHTKHVQGQGLGRIDGADSHQCRNRGHVESLGEATQMLYRVSVDHAAAGIDQGSLALSKHREKRRRLRVIPDVVLQLIHALAITRDRQQSGAAEFPGPVLYVLRDIDDHRTRAPGPGYFKCGTDGCLQPGRIGHEENVFRAAAHDAGNGRFLEGIGADRGGRHLAADNHDRNGIGHTVAYRRNGVGGARTGSHHDHANLAGGAGVTGRHKGCALFVCGYDQ